MTEIKHLPIPDGIYGGKLNAELWKIQYDESFGKGMCGLLLEILKTDLLTISEKGLRARFPTAIPSLLAIDIQSMTNNKELLARCLELQLYLDRSRIQSTLKIVTRLYWDIFQETHDYVFLVRRLVLVRLAKGIFQNDLPAIFDQVKQIVANLPYPYWQYRLISQMPAIFDAEVCRDLLQAGLLNKVSELTDKGDFTGARLCLQSLGALGTLNANECLIQQALLYEREGDKIIAEKKPNTFYPTISLKFSEGFRLIKDLEDGLDIRNRLVLKLQAAQLEDAKMIAAAGVNMMPTIDVKRIQQDVAGLNLKSFELAFSALLDIPILSLGLINGKAAEEEANQSFVASLFSTHVRISIEGKSVGFSEGEEAKAIQVRMQYREILIILIKMIKDVMDLYMVPIKEAIYENLAEIDSPFIPKGNLYPFMEGLFQGFENNFVIASHMLVPQIESSLRHLAKAHQISITNYSKKKEFDNTLGGVLEKVKHLLDEDLLAELKNFLADSSDVNFRNELLHAFMSPERIQHYGIYIWWLTLKMVFQSKCYFKSIVA